MGVSVHRFRCSACEDRVCEMTIYRFSDMSEMKLPALCPYDTDRFRRKPIWHCVDEQMNNIKVISVNVENECEDEVEKLVYSIARIYYDTFYVVDRFLDDVKLVIVVNSGRYFYIVPTSRGGEISERV